MLSTFPRSTLLCSSGLVLLLTRPALGMPSYVQRLQVTTTSGKEAKITLLSQNPRPDQPLAGRVCRDPTGPISLVHYPGAGGADVAHQSDTDGCTLFGPVRLAAGSSTIHFVFADGDGLDVGVYADDQSLGWGPAPYALSAAGRSVAFNFFGTPKVDHSGSFIGPTPCVNSVLKPNKVTAEPVDHAGTPQSKAPIAWGTNTYDCVFSQMSFDEPGTWRLTASFPDGDSASATIEVKPRN